MCTLSDKTGVTTNFRNCPPPPSKYHISWKSVQQFSSCNRRTLIGAFLQLLIATRARAQKKVNWRVHFVFVKIPYDAWGVRKNADKEIPANYTDPWRELLCHKTWDIWLYNFPLKNSSSGVYAVIYESIILTGRRGLHSARQQWGICNLDKEYGCNSLVWPNGDASVSLSPSLSMGGILDTRITFFFKDTRFCHIPITGQRQPAFCWALLANSDMNIDSVLKDNKSVLWHLRLMAVHILCWTFGV
jgi:hypothetical protein